MEPLVATSFGQRLSSWLCSSSAARGRQLRRLGLSLGVGLSLLWSSPTALLAQMHLPPPPPVGPALDTPAAKALLQDGALPLPQDTLRTPGSASQPSKVTEAQPESGVPVVLVERSSSRRLLLLPGGELRIEETPELPPLTLPTLSPSKERLLYPLPHPAPITSGFGLRIHPLKGQPEFHAGVDLGASLGTPVLAALSGKVVSAGSLGDLGITVVLEHAGGRRTRYGHLSQVAVTPGEGVKQGSLIGYVGATGAVTGPHLHFELWQQTAGQSWMVLDATEELKVAAS
ncbi:M23 family metallopeptidase [Synechococcus sp. W70.1]|uniref:M23 family metallopeptidase n=1 Tax=Synechococcus sp. W70.1 TaxID=2964534 RepID=UPI0039C39CE1